MIPSLEESQEKIDFFLISAHELRTSLTAMKWLLKMLLDGDFGTLNETQSAMLTQATGSNDRMIALINDTMTVIKTTDTAVTYAKEPVSLSLLTEESIRDFTSEAATRGMHIRYTGSPTPIIVIGDIDKLRIVLHNLFENAIKYGTSNTDITITLSGQDGIATLSVKDIGAIIPPEEQHHVFEKFFRASTTEHTHAGVGLGLYATKHIIEKHNGALNFISTPETGTIFTLTLPLG